MTDEQIVGIFHWQQHKKKDGVQQNKIDDVEPQVQVNKYENKKGEKKMEAQESNGIISFINHLLTLHLVMMIIYSNMLVR